VLPPESISRQPPIAASCSGVVKVYWNASNEVQALKGIDAVFQTGTVTLVMGPSGSGKSSLLRILACIERPTAGEVRVGETQVNGLQSRSLRALRGRLLSYVFARPSDNLVPYLTAKEHLAMWARIRGGRADEVVELLEAIGLTGRAKHHPGELSGGEQQRLALAAAVVGEPTLILSDEMTSELDSQSGRRLMGLVRELAARGRTFVVASHDPALEEMADVVIHLRHGSVEAETKSGGRLAVIDSFGRIQMPPEALGLFPSNRAQIRVLDGQVVVEPP
jgi:putative ABC transport system ATP-binding protein